jgi:integrase
MMLMALTDMALANAKPKEKDYKLSDSKGLYCLVKTNKAKYWRWAYRYNNKQKTMAFGVYPEVTIKMARDKRDAARLILIGGDDPQEHLKETKLKRIEEIALTLPIRDVIDKFFIYYSDGKDFKTINKAEGLLRNWVKPVIGNIECGNIKAQDVLGLIRKIEEQGKRPTAHKVAALLNGFFAYCIADPDVPIDRNWLNDIKTLIKPAPEKHHPALITPKEVGRLLCDMDSSKSYWLTRIAMKLSIHWFIRPGELRTIKWDNVNWDLNCIQIDKEVMKKTSTNQDHWIPMSTQAKEMLVFIKQNNRPSEYVFPSIRSLLKPMSENTVNSAIRCMGYVGKQTAHGLRATARTLLDEELSQNPEYIEHQLAHKVKDANGRAYNRTTKLDERRVMLQLWSDYLDELESKTKQGIVIKSKYETSL